MDEEAYNQDSYRNSTTLFIYYGLRALVLGAGAWFLIRGDWETGVTAILLFVLMLLPSIFRHRYRLYLPFVLDLGIVCFTFFTMFLGEIAHFYVRVPLWDKFLHAQSGFLLGATGYVLVYLLNEHKKSRLHLSPIFISIFAVTFALSIGVAWEIGEFTGDNIFGTHWQIDNADTMGDLIADLSGALIVSIIGYFWMHRHQRLPFTPWLFREIKPGKRLKDVLHLQKLGRRRNTK